MKAAMRPVRTGPGLSFLFGAHWELPKPGCVICQSLPHPW